MSILLHLLTPLAICLPYCLVDWVMHRNPEGLLDTVGETFLVSYLTSLALWLAGA